MMRDSPPELARAFAGPYASISATFFPRLARCHAVHAPKTPAPTTATSYAFWPLIVQASYQMYLPCEVVGQSPVTPLHARVGLLRNPVFRIGWALDCITMSAPRPE